MDAKRKEEGAERVALLLAGLADWDKRRWSGWMPSAPAIPQTRRSVGSRWNWATRWKSHLAQEGVALTNVNNGGGAR